MVYFETKYLRTEEERAPYKLTVDKKTGLLMGADGKPYDTSDAELKGLSNSKGRAMLVMDKKGNLYAMKDQIRGKLHHTTLLAGGPVAFAGEIIVENGKLTLIGSKSGHYHTPTTFMAQLFDSLEKQGIDVSQVRLEMFGD
jgi:hypothetical protein